MKLWLDDIRVAPPDYTYYACSVDAAKMMIISAEEIGEKIECIDCDYDLGNFARYGGNGIQLLEWLTERETFYPIKIHSENPVERASMEKMIQRYWRNFQVEDENMKDDYRIVVDIKDFQEKVLDYISSDKINKHLDNTIYANNKECRSAMIYGMSIASMLTSSCDLIYIKNVE